MFSEELEELHQTNGPKPETRSLLSPYLAGANAELYFRKHRGLRSAVFVVMTSVLWGAADARNMVGEFYGINVFVAFLLLHVFKGSTLLFCDVPPFILVDIYLYFGGNMLLPSAGYKKMEAGSSETLYTRLHGVFFIVKAERDLNFATVLIRVVYLLYYVGFGPAQFVIHCIRTSWILRQRCRC